MKSGAASLQGKLQNKKSRSGIIGKYERLPVDMMDPNPWNPNKVSALTMQKLSKGIKEVRAKTGGIPPVVVRPSPDHPGRYQIIDGEHRWRIFKDEKLDTQIDAFLIQADDELAKRLTLNLNYMRGEPAEDKEAQILADLVKEGWTPEDLGETLYLDQDAIIDKLAAYDQNDALAEILRQEKEEGDGDGEGEAAIEDRVWVDLTFKVSVSQAQVIEKEITRIGNQLKGKNVRGRALELMAANSSGVPLEDE